MFFELIIKLEFWFFNNFFEGGWIFKFLLKKWLKNGFLKKLLLGWVISFFVLILIIVKLILFIVFVIKLLLFLVLIFFGIVCNVINWVFDNLLNILEFVIVGIVEK